MITIGLMNYDEVYHNSFNQNVLPCDVSMLKTKKHAEELIKYIFLEQDTDTVINISCDCGASRGKYLLGTICEECNTIVREPTFTESQYNLWLHIPEYLPPMMNAAAYNTLNIWLGKYKKMSILDGLLGDPDIILPDELQNVFPRNCWYFYEHFEEIIEWLINNYKPVMLIDESKKQTSKSIKSRHMLEYIKINRGAIFARYLPVLDNRLHVIAKEGTMTLSDGTSDHILHMAIDLANTNLRYSNDPDNKEQFNYAWLSLLRSYISYAKEILDDKLLKKYGLIRRHLLGGRCHFSFRAVISPVTDLAPMDELKLPYTLGVNQFKLEILNILMNREKYTLYNAIQKHEKAIDNFDPDIMRILNLLVEECPYKGLPILLGRNPTMIHGSIQTFFCKDFVMGHTIHMHPGVMKAPNADCDGDALYGTPIKEMSMVPEYLKLHPMTTMLTSQTLSISPIVNVGVQVAANINAWLHAGY